MIIRGGLLVVLLCSSFGAVAHGSSHPSYRMEEKVDDLGQPFLVCHEVTITTSHGFTLHNGDAAFRPDYLVTEAGYLRLQEYVGEKCGRSDSYSFEIYPDEIEGNFYRDNRTIDR